MKHLQPMFIVPRDFSEAQASKYMLASWEAVHLHTEPGADDATHEVLTGLFRNHELEEEFRLLAEVQNLPDVLESHVTLHPDHHAHFARVKHLGITQEHNAYQVRKLIREQLQKGF